MQKFKVLTLNIHKGFSMSNRKFTLQSIRDRLRESDANIVFLQEVIGENQKHSQNLDEWPEANQFEYLADTVWDHYAYGRNAIYQHGHHGNAILSELPIVDFRNIDISVMRFSQRGILHGQLQNGVHVLCVHLGLFEQERRKQIDRLTQYINSEVPAEDPLVLAGDFNDWRKTAHKQLKTACQLKEVQEEINHRLAATFPAITPLLPMDRIYTRGFHISAVNVLTSKPWRQLSDHCALTAELSLNTDDST